MKTKVYLSKKNFVRISNEDLGKILGKGGKTKDPTGGDWEDEYPNK